MDILIRRARIIDPTSPFHQQTTNILIRDGRIAAIGASVTATTQVVEAEGLCVSPGWVDSFAQFPDPGQEYRETLETGAAAAAAGGFTDVMVLPNTKPVVHNKSGVEYMVQRSKTLPANIHPIGAVTRETEGKELAEMYDMEASGAVAFSDGVHSIQSAGLLLKALQYLKAIDRTIIQVPEDKSIAGPGLMNEGIVSTRLGLPGKPAISEELMIVRDLELAAYTGSKIHFTGISTAKACELIAAAKARGIAVTASVTPAHLCYCDEDLQGYDTNLKMNPPLRTAADRDALRHAVASGIIDCIASHHFPHDTDKKVVEFEYAKDGMIALETSWSVVRTCMPELSEEQLVALFSINPRRIFGLKTVVVQENEEAVMSVFTLNDKWTPSAFLSRSKNSAFTGRELRGKVLGIINGQRLFLK